jgi:hypothetical protein
MELSITAAGTKKNRLVATRLTLLTLRYMENWSRVSKDYDEAMIAVAVAAITTERMTRMKPSAEHLDLKHPLPRNLYAKCTVQAVALATGLNRETARRKINNLVSKGVLERGTGNTVLLREGLPQEQFIAAVIKDQLEAFSRTANALIRDGVLRIGRNM